MGVTRMAASTGRIDMKDVMLERCDEEEGENTCEQLVLHAGDQAECGMRAMQSALFLAKARHSVIDIVEGLCDPGSEQPPKSAPCRSASPRTRRSISHAQGGHVKS
jgi:hypothetical protein